MGEKKDVIPQPVFPDPEREGWLAAGANLFRDGDRIICHIRFTHTDPSTDVWASGPDVMEAVNNAFSGLDPEIMAFRAPYMVASFPKPEDLPEWNAWYMALPMKRYP